ncbi:MAG: hypothetical protein Q8903_14950 [Bacteroidota bacterium]|nr:hypothetical protein [Bacteroidota bacterium]
MRKHITISSSCATTALIIESNCVWEKIKDTNKLTPIKKYMIPKKNKKLAMTQSPLNRKIPFRANLLLSGRRNRKGFPTSALHKNIRYDDAMQNIHAPVLILMSDQKMIK